MYHLGCERMIHLTAQNFVDHGLLLIGAMESKPPIVQVTGIHELNVAQTEEVTHEAI